MEKIIWSNKNIQPNKEFYLSEHPEIFEGLSERQIEEKLWEMEEENICLWLDDERANLNIQLNGPILVLADLGLWNGRRYGYKIIKSGNVSDILYSETDYAKWYFDGHNVKCEAIHHDGTNYYEYREIRDIDKIQPLLDDIYEGNKISRQKLNRYTKSIAPVVRKVYGW